MIEKLLDKMKGYDPLILLVLFLGNTIIVLAIVMSLYPQLILPVLQSNNYYLVIAASILILIPAAFFSTVELYFLRGFIKLRNRHKQKKAQRKFFQNLPPLYKIILRQLMLNPSHNFALNPKTSAALSELERQGFIRGSGIPRIYYLDIEWYVFFRENQELLNY